MFTPVIPMGGLAGWRFLERTYSSQTAAYNKSAPVKSATDYYRENVAKVNSANDLVSDRRLLEVALGAFGLQDDIDNKFFLQKMLEEGSLNDDALANKLSDPRYATLVKAFGFGPGEIRKVSLSFAIDEIVDKYLSNSFEVATGEQDESMRIALYAKRTLSDLATSSTSNNAKWFTIMGQPPMRKLFETALNLPAAFGQIAIDQHLSVFKERAASVFGSDLISQFADPEAIDDLVVKYIARAQIASMGSSSSSSANALTLLQA